MTTDSFAAQKNAVNADAADQAVRTSAMLARKAQPEAAGLAENEAAATEESAPQIKKLAAMQTLAAAGEQKGERQ